MYKLLNERLLSIGSEGLDKFLRNSKIGLEKESLRVNKNGAIAQSRHPETLGSALTNPLITTDYSEALLEFITPPMDGIQNALNFLKDVQQFVYNRIDNEILWATSMPCVVAGESSIPIAYYGESNPGKMKSIYRVGLGYRYGRVMQVIAGVHYNFSLSNKFWNGYSKLLGAKTSIQDFKSDSYMHLIRNLIRVGWLIPYLFGASPAVCKSFLKGADTDLKEFDENTFYEPFATSLRMGDIGYQNNKENEIGIKACYDNLDEYIANLKFAIETPCEEFEKIGVLVDGQYRQLNANILQIENEYYSTVRPKQIPEKNEMPLLSLKRRGIEYIELRSLDVNVFDPMGINETQLYFLEALMLFSLLNESPEINNIERKEIDDNEMLVAHKGRLPRLELNRNSKTIYMKDWASEIFSEMSGVCEILDKANSTGKYTESLKILEKSVHDPELTPSAQMLEEMRNNHEGFHDFAKRKSLEHSRYFLELEQNKEVNSYLQNIVNVSFEKQKEIEQEDNLTFEQYLENYYAQ